MAPGRIPRLRVLTKFNQNLAILRRTKHSAARLKLEPAPFEREEQRLVAEAAREEEQLALLVVGRIPRPGASTKTRRPVKPGKTKNEPLAPSTPGCRPGVPTRRPRCKQHAVKPGKTNGIRTVHLLIRRQDGTTMDSHNEAPAARRQRFFASFAPLCGQFVFPVCSPSCEILGNTVEVRHLLSGAAYILAPPVKPGKTKNEPLAPPTPGCRPGVPTRRPRCKQHAVKPSKTKASGARLPFT